MKQLKLKALKLGAKELLTREQLKKVLGGGGSGCSYSQCSASSECGSCTCQYKEDSHSYCS